MSSEHVEVLERLRDYAEGLAAPVTLHAEDVAEMTALIRDAIASLSAPQSDYWALVPIEPTPEMLSAAHYELADKPFSNNAERSARAYAAMLAAAPQPPAEARAVASAEDRFEQFLQAAIARSPEPLRELAEYLSGLLDENQWPTADRLLLQIAIKPMTAPPSAPVGVDGAMELMRKMINYCDEVLAQEPAAVDGWVLVIKPDRDGETGVWAVSDDGDSVWVSALAAQPGGSDNDR